jgi:hypothetical protein
VVVVEVDILRFFFVIDPLLLVFDPFISLYLYIMIRIAGLLSCYLVISFAGIRC